ncbi:hypothetical protein Pelo_16696 [Pelomyxa schiedti]|nr:hypothetical protein Pelo_16696 [Pelomyxa schiedti]
MKHSGAWYLYDVRDRVSVPPDKNRDLMAVYARANENVPGRIVARRCDGKKGGLVLRGALSPPSATTATATSTTGSAATTAAASNKAPTEGKGGGGGGTGGDEHGDGARDEEVAKEGEGEGADAEAEAEGDGDAEGTGGTNNDWEHCEPMYKIHFEARGKPDEWWPESRVTPLSDNMLYRKRPSASSTQHVTRPNKGNHPWDAKLTDKLLNAMINLGEEEKPGKKIEEILDLFKQGNSDEPTECYLATLKVYFNKAVEHHLLLRGEAVMEKPTGKSAFTEVYGIGHLLRLLHVLPSIASNFSMHPSARSQVSASHSKFISFLDENLSQFVNLDDI